MLKNEVRVCEHCGVIIGDGDNYTIDGNGRITCDDCLQDMYYCEVCGNAFEADDIVCIYDRYGDIVQFVCSDCAETYYHQCPECGRWYTQGTFSSTRQTCPNCTPDVILPYHAHNPNGLQFHGSTEYSFINGYIAGELEITGLDNRAAADILEACGGYDFCHFEHDCSVDGAEIIFQPRTIESWEAVRPAINSMYDILKEYDCSAEAGNGLHIHISRTAFGSTNEEQAEAIAKFMRLFTEYNHVRCCTIAECSPADAREWARDCGQYTKEQQKHIAEAHTGDRYIAVNVTNDDTVEVRLGRSTMDIDKFYSWIHFIAAMVRRAETIDFKEADDFNEWLYGAPSDVQEFVRNAGVDFTEPVRPIPTERYEEIIRALARTVANVENATGRFVNQLDVLQRIAHLTENEARVLGLLQEIVKSNWIIEIRNGGTENDISKPVQEQEHQMADGSLHQETFQLQARKCSAQCHLLTSEQIIKALW